MRLKLIRHPEPIGAAGLCYGRSDVEVDPVVMDQAVTVVRERLRLSADQPYRVVSSPLRRCSTLAARLDPTYWTDDRLTELDFGSWERQRWDDIDRAEFDHWAEDYVHRRPPGGQSWDEVSQAVADFLAERRRTSEPLLVVTHAGVIRAALSHVLGIDLAATWRIGLPFTAVVEVDVGADPDQDRLVSLLG